MGMGTMVEVSMKPLLSRMALAPTDGNHDDTPNLNYTYHFNTDKAFNETATVKPQFDGITYSFVYGERLIYGYIAIKIFGGEVTVMRMGPVHI